MRYADIGLVVMAAQRFDMGLKTRFKTIEGIFNHLQAILFRSTLRLIRIYLFAVASACSGVSVRCRIGLSELSASASPQ
jgi:hypothetical protein